jgi:hypothetical protein
VGPTRRVRLCQESPELFPHIRIQNSNLIPLHKTSDREISRDGPTPIGKVEQEFRRTPFVRWEMGIESLIELWDVGCGMHNL